MKTAPFLLLAGLFATPATAAIEESYTQGEPPITTTWFAAVSPTALQADRDFVGGMRPHHAGALSMSAEYLADPDRRSPLLDGLARAIIVNQRFEIGMLDEVERNLDAPPLRLPFGIVLRPVATEGLTGLNRFFRAPIPSPVERPIGPVSRRDVLFAKAMTIHHQAALRMAADYHANPAARNGYLGLMNVDIVTDQTQEIALMRQVVAAFPDAAGVIVDPAMVHGMDGMDGHETAAAPADRMPAHDHAPAPAAPAPHRH